MKPNKIQNLWAYGWGRKKEKLEGQRLTLLVHLLDHTRENISSKNNKKETPMICNVFYQRLIGNEKHKSILSFLLYKIVEL
jgi:hypothetical protein